MDGFGRLCGGDDGDGQRRGGGQWRRRQEGVQCRWSRAGAFHHSMGTGREGFGFDAEGGVVAGWQLMRLLPPGQGRLLGGGGAVRVGRQATGDRRRSCLGEAMLGGREAQESGEQWKLAAAVSGDGDGDSGSGSDSDGPEAGPRTTQTRRSGSQQGRQGDNDWPQPATVPRMEPGALAAQRRRPMRDCDDPCPSAKTSHA